MHKRLSDSILNGALDIDDDAQNNDNNPMITGDWITYLDGARNELFEEFDGNRLKNDIAEIKQQCKAKMDSYNHQFKEAVQIDEIEDFDDDENRNHNRESSEDDDIIIDRQSNVNIGSIKCPFTQTVFVYPVKSKICGHTFEKEAVERYIQTQAQKQEIPKCPLPGCSNLLTADQMIRDVKMEKLIKAQSKQQQDEGSDDDAMDLTVPE